MKIRNMVRKYAAPALVAASAVASTAASAAIDEATVNTVKTAVIADAGTASGAGFSVMAVVLSLSIGFGLLQTFVRKGAQG
ncbi:hypothetical protein [Aeromonas enteropelogenes]|uniref:hypothetical protein n=1 Tax=Aeromonas enteropelogenes TaxID=29489 RepID=UPI000F54941C|nr:hypothetical protein [Aeromonas enteropelogenes]RQM71370.1 hypothetical protein EHZ64_00130 [Aeromonas enteropelogenes]